MSLSAAALKEAIRTQACTLGCDACAFAKAEHVANTTLEDWLSAGYHADMTWMEKHTALRKNPCLLLKNAQTVIVVAQNYYYERPPAPPHTGQVARYAWGQDYHKALRKRLRKLAQYIQMNAPEAQCRIAVDSAPLLERYWAQQAGLGWIGKNGLVLRKDIGSWFFLGIVLTTLVLPPDEPAASHCGTCTACIDACPTAAIVEPGVIDARRCIAYHTIENREAIPEELHGAMGNRLFGCDTCQEVCPWNRHRKESAEPAFAPRKGVANPSPDALLKMDESTFDIEFAGTPVRRAKHAGIQRNAAIVKDNLDKQ